MATLQEQIAQLETAIAAQESLRSTLGDALVATVTATLRAQLDSLRAQLHAATAPGTAQQLFSRFMPPELARKMRASAAAEGERKTVTVLFADLSGFTAVSERFDPEVIRSFQDDLFPEMAEAVYQYEGHIDKFIGDAIMAVFGAPIAHENDPERALRAALSMRERMARLNRRWMERLGTELNVHIGVNTGMVVAGVLDPNLGYSYTVTGDTVNTASRLQSAAQPGQILVSRETYRLAQGAFYFAALEPITVKGKHEPVPTFELQRAKLLPSKARGLKELASAFVGRERELAQLRAIGAELLAGRGRIVSINGEAGVGKSRLLAEWQRELGEQVRWTEGHAFAHTSSLAYGLFLDMFRRYARIRDEDSEVEARAKLDDAVSQLLPGQPDARAIFTNLLALRLAPDEAALMAALSADALRRRLSALIQAMFERLAQERPTILVFEDLHWADYTSLEVIENLLPLVERLPLMLVGVQRFHPGERPGKLRHVIEAQYARWFTDITLTNLSESASIDMVAQLLSTALLPDALRAMVWRKAEGNPFFVEEVLRVLIERGALMRAETGWVTTAVLDSLSVPDTVQGVLMARLDVLPEETKWVVQQASVIGRIFLYRVLWHIANSNVDADLNRLEQEELIHERARLPEVEYIFKHALTQEVAYQSLLTPRRKELHRKVGTALETLFAARIGEFQSIIGEHYLKGEAWEQAVDYLVKAGDAMTRLNAYAEARVHYGNALGALAHLPEDDAQRRRLVDITVKRVSVSLLVDDPQQNIERLQGAEAIARTLTEPADRLRLARVHFWMGRAHYYQNQAREALRYFAQVLPVAQEFNDEELMAYPASAIGRAFSLQGQFAKAEALLAQAIPVFARTANWLEWIRTTGCLAICIAGRGRYADGVQTAMRAIAKSQETNNLTGLATIYSYLALVHMLGGDPAQMQASGRSALEAAEQSGDRVFVYTGHAFIAWANSMLGYYDQALEHMQQSQAIGQSMGGRLILVDLFAAANVALSLNAGRIAEALALAEQVLPMARALGNIFAQGIVQRAWAQALWLSADAQHHAEMEQRFADSVNLFGEGDARLEVARTHRAWGDVCRTQGKLAEARAHYGDAATCLAASDRVDELAEVQLLLRGERADSVK